MTTTLARLQSLEALISHNGTIDPTPRLTNLEYVSRCILLVENGTGLKRSHMEMCNRLWICYNKELFESQKMVGMAEMIQDASNRIYENIIKQGVQI
jgi:hypothetical protein